MKAICVFCGSSTGSDPAFLQAADTLGRLIAESGKILIYGGYRYGTMGALVDASLAANGTVIGVIPAGLFGSDTIHPDLSKHHTTVDMQQRKQLMANLSDAFISLPGGIGTLDELFEMWVLTQLGVHVKPSGILNLNGYYDRLLEFLDSVVSSKFLSPANRRLLIDAADPATLLQRLQTATDNNR